MQRAEPELNTQIISRNANDPSIRRTNPANSLRRHILPIETKAKLFAVVNCHLLKLVRAFVAMAGAIPGKFDVLSREKYRRCSVRAEIRPTNRFDTDCIGRRARDALHK